jgi:hypothetical protein
LGDHLLERRGTLGSFRFRRQVARRGDRYDGRRISVAIGLRQFVLRINSAQLLREGFAQGQAFGALGQLVRRHFAPHADQVAVAVGLHVFGVFRDAPEWPAAAGLQHAHLGRRRRIVFNPDVAPRTIGAAPERAFLALIFAAAIRSQPVAVDAGLRLHYFAPLAGVPTFDGEDLPREGIEPGALALGKEKAQFVI